ncbi:MAG: aminotransferase class IV [Bacillota bacterium]|nr:aminotransferase class IV [Bacillota bacterium]
MKEEKVIADGIITDRSALDEILARDRLEIYEVVRICAGKPIFASEHYDRLVKSLASVGKEPVVSLDEFIGQIDQVVKANDLSEGNLRIEQYREPGDDTEHINIYHIPAVYPTDEMFAHGVTVAFMRAERDNPQAKIFDMQLRQKADEMIEKTGVTEVLLVNRNGEITEGSRSNVFFIKDNTVIAAPQHTVLPGITRMKVLQIMREDGIRYEEAPLKADEIDKFDSAFLTGTSKEVLPIATIESTAFDVDHPILRRLMRRYSELASV